MVPRHAPKPIAAVATPKKAPNRHPMAYAIRMGIGKERKSVSMIGLGLERQLYPHAHIELGLLGLVLFKLHAVGLGLGF